MLEKKLVVDMNMFLIYVKDIERYDSVFNLLQIEGKDIENSKIQTMIREDRGYPLISQHKGGDQIKCMKSQRLAEGHDST